MRLKSGLLAAAIAAASIAAGANAGAAAAQERNSPPILLVQALIYLVGTPPCAPTVPVPDAANCAFDTTVWGLEKGQQVTRIAQGAFNTQLERAEMTTKEALAIVDAAEKTAVYAACDALGIPAEECPQI